MPRRTSWRWDAQTRRNLELFQAGRWENRQLSLLAALDLTRTPMGGRLLRRWVGQPLLEPEALERRLDAVEYFVNDTMSRARTREILGGVADLERILGRIQTETATPRDLIALNSGIPSRRPAARGAGRGGERPGSLAAGPAGPGSRRGRAD